MRYDLVDKVSAQRIMSVHKVSGEAHFFCALQPNSLLKKYAHPARGYKPNSCMRIGKSRTLRGNKQIAGKCELEAASYAGTIDGTDYWLGDSPECCKWAECRGVASTTEINIC